MRLLPPEARRAADSRPAPGCRWRNVRESRAPAVKIRRDARQEHTQVIKDQPRNYQSAERAGDPQDGSESPARGARLSLLRSYQAAPRPAAAAANRQA